MRRLGFTRSRRSKSRLLGVLALAALTAIVAVGCGSEEPESGAALPPATTASQVPTTTLTSDVPTTTLTPEVPTTTVPTEVPTTTVPTATVPGTPEMDRAALEALYLSTDGANWYNNDNWLSDAPLGQWAGVFIDSASGRVVDLNLDANALALIVHENAGVGVRLF